MQMSYSQPCYISFTQIHGLQEWPQNTRKEWDEEQDETKLPGSKKGSLAWKLPNEQDYITRHGFQD